MTKNKTNMLLAFCACVLPMVFPSGESVAYDYSERMQGEAILPLAYPDRPFVLRFSRDDLLQQSIWSTKVGDIVIAKSSPNCVRVGAEALRKSILSLKLGTPSIIEIDANAEEFDENTTGRDLILLGTVSGSRLVESLARKYGLEVNNAAMNEDGYVIKPVKQGDRCVLLVAASSDRGAMYGAYELEERTTKRGVPAVDDAFVPKVKYRSWALHTFVDEPYSLVGRLRLNVSMTFDDYWPGTLF